MGGYLSVSYAERFPDRVEKLVLLSPVGVPAWNADTDKERYAAANWRFKSLITIARSAWKMGITPMSFIRALPEGRGKKLVDTYVFNRLHALQDDEKRLLSDYFYNISCMPGSGEYCLQHILRPGAYSRVALADRIPKLDVKDVSFIYGQHDWMDVNGGMEVQEKLENLKKENAASTNCEVRVVMEAGHLLMLENPDGTNSQLAMSVDGKGKEHTIKTGQIYRNEENKLVFSQRPTKVKVGEVGKNQV